MADVTDADREAARKLIARLNSTRPLLPELLNNEAVEVLAEFRAADAEAQLDTMTAERDELLNLADRLEGVVDATTARLREAEGRLDTASGHINDLIAACGWLDACSRDATANAYDGATTRSTAKRIVTQASEFLTMLNTPTPEPPHEPAE